MARTRKLTVEILGDASSLSRAFQTINKDTQSLGDQFRSFARKSVVPATAALGALAFQANKSVQAAAGLEEAVSKTGVLFGDVTDQILEFSKTTANTFGISQKATLDAASTFAIFGKSAGLAGDDLASFSIDFVKLAGDFASFFDTSPEDAITAIGAALRGEAEPIRRFGVLLNEATLREEAFRMGLIKTTKQALTPQQRVLAARNVIFAQTSDAQGDAARTADSFTNRQRRLTAQMEDFNIQVGQILLPIFERLLPLLQRFADWASRNPELIVKVAAAVGALSAALIVLNFALSVNPYVLATAALMALGAAFYVLYQRSEPARRVMNAIGVFILATAVPAFTMFGAVVYALGRAFKFLWDNMSKPLNALKNFSLKGFGLGSLLGGFLPGIGSLGGGLLGGLKNAIPFMADGGVVSSATLSVIGEAGPEAVVPLDRMGEFGGGGDTFVTINVSGGDPQAVVNALVRWSRQNGTLPSTIRVA